MTIESKLAGIFMQKCSDHDDSKYYENLRVGENMIFLIIWLSFVVLLM